MKNRENYIDRFPFRALRTWHWREEGRHAFLQELGSGGGVGIAGTQRARDGIAAFEQAVRVARAEPAAFFCDADGHHVEFLAIDCLENRSGREQRDFVLTAATTEQNANAQFFCHCLPGLSSVGALHPSGFLDAAASSSSLDCARESFFRMRSR